MIANLIFANTQWLWPVGISALIIWVVFIWKEWFRFGKPKFFINVIIAFIAISTLATIILKPLTTSPKKSYHLALLTVGYKSTQLDSLKQIYKRLKVINYSNDQLIIKDEDIPDSIFILGHGIKPYDLWQLDAFKVNYLGGQALKGISDLKYKTNSTVGVQAIINGRYLNATLGSKLVLEDPSGEALDSISLETKTTQEFQLEVPLKVQGKYLLELIEKDSLGNRIRKDPLPIIVAKKSQLKILILNNFPTFETKYLKNYLAENGHQVLNRSQLTTNRYKYEYFNMDNRPFVAMTKKALASFDLLIIDAISLQNLSKSKRNTLENSVREDGLGIFIQPNDSYFQSHKNLFSFKFVPDDNKTSTLEAWPKVDIGSYAFGFNSEFGLEAMLNGKSKLLSAYKRKGAGKIGTTLFKNTYELALNGHTEIYQQIWSKIVENLSKTENPIAKWHSNTPFTFKDEPFNFKLRTAILDPIVSANGDYNIPLRQDLNIASLWEGVTYPRDIGWEKQYIQQDTSAVFEYYVPASTHWQSLIANNTITTNTRYFNTQNKSDQSITKPMTPINSIWFYLIFIISMGYLWLEPKL